MLHENIMENSTTTMVFLNPKEGKLWEKTPDGEKSYAALEGTLDMVDIEFDPGNPSGKVQPHDALIIQIRSTSDPNVLYRIKKDVSNNFSTSFGAILGSLEKGSEIMLKPKPGDDPKVTFCNVSVKDSSSGNWVNPERVALPKNKDEKVSILRNAVASSSALRVSKSE